MVEMGSLIEYLKRETALNALEKTIKHVQKVQECVKELDKGIVMLLKEKDLEKTHNIFHNVDLLEGEFGGGYPSYRIPFIKSLKWKKQKIILIQKDSHKKSTKEEISKNLKNRMWKLSYNCSYYKRIIFIW